MIGMPCWTVGVVCISVVLLNCVALPFCVTVLGTMGPQLCVHDYDAIQGGRIRQSPQFQLDNFI